MLPACGTMCVCARAMRGVHARLRAWPHLPTHSESFPVWNPGWTPTHPNVPSLVDAQRYHRPSADCRRLITFASFRKCVMQLGAIECGNRTEGVTLYLVPIKFTYKSPRHVTPKSIPPEKAPRTPMGFYFVLENSGRTGNEARFQLGLSTK